MKIRFLTLFLILTSFLWAEKTVTISNLRPRTDMNGEVVDAHDGRISQFNGVYYWYGTAYGNTSGFKSSNYYQCYSSTDLTHWKKEGTLLKNAPQGIYYRPHVVYNPKTKQYVLWYNWYAQLWEGKFGVAVASRPTGPFKIVNSNVTVFNSANGVGDFGLFVDDDSVAYLVYNTINGHRGSVEKLKPDYLSSTLENGGFLTENCEAGAMFKRNGIYYLLTDHNCCFCTQGSGARVFMSTHPMTDYVEHNNINRLPGSPAPMLVDGVLSPNLHTVVKKHPDGSFTPIQIEFQGDSVLNTIKIIQFTGNRKTICGDTSDASANEPIRAPSFEVMYWKNGYWIPLRITEKAMSSSVYTLLDLRFEPIKTRRLKVLTNKNYPYDLMINEIEVSENNRLLSSGAQAYLLDLNVAKCMPQIPGQQTYVMPLETVDGIRYIWMADLWGSASDNIKGHDYQYWSAPLEFDPKGDIEPMKWVDVWKVKLP
ncbi:MAG TPA: family 43 glycosylhydrolase [Bacteroidales bacterium]|nr:family 43 glycosylhydrolase [Bacteroidales bacterium]